MLEKKTRSETLVLIGQFREIALGDNYDRSLLTQAWEKYIDINEQTLTAAPFEQIKLLQLRTIRDVLKHGGTFEHNSTTAMATVSLRSDLGLREERSGFIGNLSPEDRIKAERFAQAMADALIRPQK